MTEVPNQWPEAVLVDLDNTLHDQRGAAFRARHRLAAQIERQHGIAKDQVLGRYEEILHADTPVTPSSGVQLRRWRLRQLLDSWPPTRTVQCEQLVVQFGHALVEETRALPGAIEAYHTLSAHCRMLIVTEGYEDTQGQVLRSLGFTPTRQSLLATWDRGVKKADGSAFELACNELEISPSKIVMIGDNWAWDILAAAKAGVWQLWIGNDDGQTNPTPERYLGHVNAMSETPEFLRAIWSQRHGKVRG